MKKTIIALAALAFSGAVLAGGPTPMAAPAAPQDNMYLGFHADMTSGFHTVSSTNQKVSSPMAFNQAGFQVGMKFNSIYTEVSTDFSNYGVGHHNHSSLNLFLKASYQLALGEGLSIYPVAGIGLRYCFAEGGLTESNTGFAWLLGAGTSLTLNSKMSISGEYNYQSLPKTNSASDNHDIGANVFSIRWNHTF